MGNDEETTTKSDTNIGFVSPFHYARTALFSLILHSTIFGDVLHCNILSSLENFRTSNQYLAKQQFE